jgi:hypothetical protein
MKFLNITQRLLISRNGFARLPESWLDFQIATGNPLGPV